MSSALDEVQRLHVFFQNWLSSADDNEAGWQGFSDALADGFEMVVPDGRRLTRIDLLASFGAARGTRPGVQIEIRDAVVLNESTDTATVRYEEWQLHEEFGNQRISTAVLRQSEVAPLGWVWLALHESWLADR